MKEQKLIFDARVVTSGYVIARFANDDTRMYMNKNDPCDYLSEYSNWEPIEEAKIFPNEATLAQALETENQKAGAAVCIPIFMQTTITTVDTKSFDEHLLQRKIAKALAKLDDEDLVVLGLQGKPE